MNEKDLIATQTIKQVSEGGDKVRADLKATAAAQDQLAASSGNLATVTETSAKRQSVAAGALDALTRKADPAARALFELEKAQRDVDRALALSPGRVNEAGRALDVYVGKLDAARAAQARLAQERSPTSSQNIDARMGIAQPVSGSARASAEAFFADMGGVEGIARARGEQIGKAFQDGFNQRMGIGGGSKSARDSAMVFEESAKAQDMMAASATRLRAAINPLEAEQGRLAAELRNYKQALDAGKISQGEYAAAQTMAGKRLGDFAQNLRVAGTAGRAMSGELVNMGYQLNDIVTGLALGQSPFMILAQQGGQVVQILQNSKASIGEFAKTAATSLAGVAGTFLKSTGGIVTAVLAVGTAAIYAASQFVRASTTVEEALEKQNSLLKEGKALLDARTSAEARAQLQSKEQTQFETLRNQLDLQNKLNQAMEKAADTAARRSSTPTEVPGEMGAAPTAFAALSDPGLDKMTAAFVALREAQAAGLPGLKEYNAELAKIGLAHPELAQTVQEMIKAGEGGLQLEFAAQRAKAMSDALKGIATDAQLAAVGLGSIAQFAVNDQQAKEAAAATERQAVATMQLAQIYPSLTIEVAKQQAAHNAQLPVIQAITGAQQMAAQYAFDYANALAMGKTQADALALAAMNLEKSQAAATASVLKQVESLKDANAMIKAHKNGTEASTAAAIAYKNAIASGADETSAASLKAETLKNYMLQASSAAGSFASNLQIAGGFADHLAQVAATGLKLTTDGGGAWSYEVSETGGTFNPDPKNTTSRYETGIPWGSLTMNPGSTQRGSSNSLIAAAYAAGGGSDERTLEILKGLRINDGMNSRYGVTSMTGSQSDIDAAIAKLESSINSLKGSTDSLNATNRELLSPYYSLDPRTSKIGFRSQGMADGGFVVPGAPSANDNMTATFPIASGEKVLYVDPQWEKRGGKGGGSSPVTVIQHITIQGNANKDDVGRTLYHNGQSLVRQLQASGQ